ncbi:hypothetical protein CP557_21140 [Natrinema ejinorense]|uniref:Uncharacterized protein n=1 Tax=Natrinema ejinorense TaxID=373386 RepID=A0A2A5QQ67_9EURY|nr:hypothetical protein CP557_21140 [Natrinema ejinorense]
MSATVYLCRTDSVLRQTIEFESAVCRAFYRLHDADDEKLEQPLESLNVHAMAYTPEPRDSLLS